MTFSCGGGFVTSLRQPSNMKPRHRKEETKQGEKKKERDSLKKYDLYVENKLMVTRRWGKG